MVLGGSIPLPYKFTASPMIFAQSGSPYNVALGLSDSVTLGFNDRPEFAPGVTAATANCLDPNSFVNANPLNSAGAVIDENPNNQIPVNLCTGPANVSFNLRLSRSFGIGPKTAAALTATQAGRPGGPGSFGGMGGGPGGGGRPGGGGGGRGGGFGGGPGGPGGFGASSDRKYSLTVGAQAQNLFNEVPYGIPVSTLTSPKFGQTLTIGGGAFASGNAVRTIMLQASFNF